MNKAICQDTSQVLTVFQDTGGSNLNSLTFTIATSGEAPFGGTPAASPSTIQIENYDVGGAHHDNDVANRGRKIPDRRSRCGLGECGRMAEVHR